MSKRKWIKRRCGSVVDSDGERVLYVVQDEITCEVISVALEQESAELVVNAPKVTAQRDKLLWYLEQIINDLPTNRDWLNPDIEADVRALLLSKGE